MMGGFIIFIFASIWFFQNWHDYYSVRHIFADTFAERPEIVEATTQMKAWLLPTRQNKIRNAVSSSNVRFLSYQFRIITEVTSITSR